MRLRKPSPQALLVLEALLSSASSWRYGYDLTKEIGVPSGTLYPVLMRLTDQGFLEADWRASERPGAPARHAYRLTRSGVEFARASITAAAGVSDQRGIATA